MLKYENKISSSISVWKNYNPITWSASQNSSIIHVSIAKISISDQNRLITQSFDWPVTWKS